MPRASDGSVTLPVGNPVVSGTAISSSVHNATMADIASMLEDSLSRTGKGGMTVPMEFDSTGNAGAPSITFDGDTDTGIYRKTANELGIAAGGQESAVFEATGVNIPGSLEVTGNSILTGSAQFNGATTFAQTPVFQGGIGSIPRSSLPSVGQVAGTQVDINGGNSTTPVVFTSTAVLTGATGRPVIVNLQPCTADESARCDLHSTSGLGTAFVYLYRKVNNGGWSSIASWRFDVLNGENNPINIAPYLDSPGVGDIQYAYYYKIYTGANVQIFNKNMVPVAYEL